MKHYCVIVDDEPLARDLIRAHLAKIKNFEIVAECKNAIELSTLLSLRNDIDLIFLDIEMPIFRGADFLETQNVVPKVILTTAHRDYAVKAFELNVLDYLLKPISFPRFYTAIRKYLKFAMLEKGHQLYNTEDSVYISINRKKVRILCDDILYVESARDYIHIYTRTEEILTTKKPISSFFHELNENFFQVHRSYIVHINAIDSYTKKELVIGNINIPIGDKYKDNILSALEK